MCVHLFFKCWTDPRQRNLPLTIMAILVHRASHSSILNQKSTIIIQVTHVYRLFLTIIRTEHAPYLWEVRTTALPSLVTLRMQFHRNLLAFGSIPVVGSSCHNKVSNITALKHYHVTTQDMDTQINVKIIFPKCMQLFQGESVTLTKNITGGAPMKEMAVESFLLLPPL